METNTGTNSTIAAVALYTILGSGFSVCATCSIINWSAFITLTALFVLCWIYGTSLLVALKKAMRMNPGIVNYINATGNFTQDGTGICWIFHDGDECPVNECYSVLLIALTRLSLWIEIENEFLVFLCLLKCVLFVSLGEPDPELPASTAVRQSSSDENHLHRSPLLPLLCGSPVHSCIHRLEVWGHDLFLSQWTSSFKPGGKINCFRR